MITSLLQCSIMDTMLKNERSFTRNNQEDEQ